MDAMDIICTNLAKTAESIERLRAAEPGWLIHFNDGSTGKFVRFEEDRDMVVYTQDAQNTYMEFWTEPSDVYSINKVSKTRTP